MFQDGSEVGTGSCGKILHLKRGQAPLEGHEVLGFKQDGGRLTIQALAKAPDANATVIALQTK
jgi:hypothetical protein